MTSELEHKLEDVEGTYFNVVGEVNPETIQHSAQLVKAQGDKPLLRYELYWPADFALFVREGPGLVLHLAKLPGNPWVSDSGQARKKLSTGAYFVDDEETKKIIQFGQAVRINISNLVPNDGSEICAVYDWFREPEFKSLDEKTLFERLIGKKEDFVRYNKGFGVKNVVVDIGLNQILYALRRNTAVGFVPGIRADGSELNICFHPLEVDPNFIGYMRAVKLPRS